MKRFLLHLVALFVLLPLAGCSKKDTGVIDPEKMVARLEAVSIDERGKATADIFRENGWVFEPIADYVLLYDRINYVWDSEKKEFMIDFNGAARAYPETSITEADAAGSTGYFDYVYKNYLLMMK